MKKSYLTIEEVISLPTLLTSAVSNNGENIAYIKNTTDWDQNQYNKELWLYQKSLKKSVKIFCEPVSGGITWSPNSQFLAFLASKGEKDKKKTQIFIFNTEDFSCYQLTKSHESVSNVKWSPTGDKLYFLADNKKAKEIEERNKTYGEFLYINEEHTFNSLYVVDFKPNNFNKSPKKVKQNEEKEECEYQKIVSGEFYIREFVIANNNNLIAYTKTPTPLVEEYLNFQIVIKNLKTEESKELKLNNIVGTTLLFSPDSEQLLLRLSVKEKEYYNNNIDEYNLCIYNLKTEQLIQPLKNSDLNIYPISWNEKSILIKYQYKANYILAKMNEQGEIQNLYGDDDLYVRDASSSKCGNYICYIKANSTQAFELYLNDEKLSNFSQVFTGRKMCIKKHISWQNSEGIEIGGVLTLPEDFDSNKIYPLLLNIHGGPRWASFKVQAINRLYPIEQFIEKGFIVLEPNYRGSTSYGKQFETANFRKLGFGDYDDIISGVDYLIEQGYADKDRVGVMGWSQGGYISAFCSTYSNRFKAISVGAGVSDWKTYYVQTDIPLFTRSYLGFNPWLDKEIYQKTAPMTYLKTACTATLIQHGDSDHRVPVANAYELYRGLQDMKVESKLIVFKDMAHGPNKPGLNRAIMHQNLIWFSHYILGENLENLKKL
ncbi:S9 family peptidase [Clostridium sp. 'deep sea']|uniref:alpha/beta hydrolase family protein n=1 Tax=Clostridium sp. 'deep sea' TaxID=2779445 RepID=UPI0018965FB3|nr:S9 family peptidase [Clostridium sp. 'deep sea']QOR33679.1 S9 family peptidase [Clostridium sp. 'deep sea']